MLPLMSETRVGISGWRYGPWRKKFYPEKLPQKLELHFASRCLNSIEINGSFYSLQRPSSYKKWHDDTPDDFVFSLKGSRYITHLKRLKEIEEPLANFFASGLLRLEEKLGPILWQFPPSFQFDKEKFERFFDMLPRDTADAAKIAANHTEFMDDRSWTTIEKKRPMRHAVEIRHKSFINEEFVELCRKNKIAIVIADTAKKWPYMEDITSDFIYARLHGEEELYVSGYGDTALDLWADRFKKWRAAKKQRDIYVYFDNDVKVYAPFDAMGLAKRLGVDRDYEKIKSESVSTGRSKSSRDTRRSSWRGLS
jgi:uncharacterized protein YecE (DUF72 family)